MVERTGISAGRDEEGGEEERVKGVEAQFVPQKPAREFRSDAERKVLELLESKHPVPQVKWLKLQQEERGILRGIALDAEHPLRTKAITALVMSADPEHVGLLGNIVSNENEDNLVRSVAVISLGMSKNPAAGAKLALFVDDRDEFVRAKAVEALGKVGGADEYGAIVKAATEDGSPLVRSNAKNAITLMDFRLGGLKRKVSKKREGRTD